MMTNGEIDRLGQIIGSSEEVAAEDLNRLQEYRQTFQEPIASVFSFVLKTARKIDKQCIVTYRIKRIDTIIEKLHRFSDNPNGGMKLSRMWDIAGCRCILNSSDNARLYRLLAAIQKEYGQGCKLNDHVLRPKDSGYRSIHIYVKDKTTGKPIEIQIRNIEQHNWATLVEIVDLLYGAKNKENGAKSDLGKFLYLYSKKNELSEAEFAEMLRIERGKKVFERMSEVLTRNYLNIRRQWLTQQQRGSYFVITANKTKSEIETYNTFRTAEEAYYEKYLANSDSNIVLTHLRQPGFEQISMAYSNYVLAMHAFFDDYRILVSKKIINCVRESEYRNFIKYFRIYTSNVKSHFVNLSMEVNGLQSCNIDSSIPKSQINKWVKEIDYRLKMWFDETNEFLSIISRDARGSFIKKWLVKNRVKRLRKVIETTVKSQIKVKQKQ